MLIYLFDKRKNQFFFYLFFHLDASGSADADDNVQERDVVEDAQMIHTGKLLVGEGAELLARARREGRDENIAVASDGDRSLVPETGCARAGVVRAAFGGDVGADEAVVGNTVRAHQGRHIVR